MDGAGRVGAGEHISIEAALEQFKPNCTDKAGAYYSTTATITSIRWILIKSIFLMVLALCFSQDRALYKACTQTVGGRSCMKKVIENDDGS